MLQTLGQVGDFIGGIGVVVTLIYLAFEIHQNSKQTKVAAAQSIMQSLSDYYRSASETDQLARVVHMGMENLDSLTDAEATQFFFWGFSFFRLVELAHMHYRLGNVPETFWRGQVAHLEGLFAFPGCRKIYERRQNVFSKEFQEFINNAVIQGPPIATGYLDGFLDTTRR